jgi:mxaJ protein
MSIIRSWMLLGITLGPAIAVSGSAIAAPASQEKALRICAAEEAPYLQRDGRGMENKLAEVVAAALQRPVEFVWSDRPAIYLVRDYLDKERCDVVMGVDTGDPRVLTTDPYYRSTYVFVSRADTDFGAIKSWNDPRLGKAKNIAVGVGSPGEAILKAMDLYNENMNYIYSLVDFRSPRNQYVRLEPSRLVSEVASGNADLAIAFSGDVARYVKESTIKLRVEPVPPDTVPDKEGKTIPFEYGQSMAVRKADEALLKELNTGLKKAQLQVQHILREEGVLLIKAPSLTAHK